MNVIPRNDCVSIAVDFRYPVLFTEDVFNPANPTLARILKQDRQETDPELRLRVFLDAGLAAAQPELADAVVAYGKQHFPELAVESPAVYPGGEAVKDGWTYVARMIDEIAERRLCRHSYVLAIGGGAFLDAVGFAAALVHRGIRLIRLPSTALSQDDSGVGTKNGVNAAGQKNFIGTFAPPYAVINDLRLLRTLPAELVTDGIAEAFKVAIIKDRDFFTFLCDHARDLTTPTSTALKTAVRRSAELHMRHIMTSGDPFEMGDSRPLDFGHWAAHRLESMSGYAIRHGQGVGIGIALDSWYAAEIGLVTVAERDQIITGLEAAGLSTWHPLLLSRRDDGELAVLDGIEQFREHLGGRLAVTLPDGIGRKLEVNTIDRELMAKGIAFLQQRGS